METNEVRQAVVVGAGVMGHSIAQVFAQYGIEVGLVDLSDKELKRAMHLIRNNLQVLADFGRVPRDEIPSIIGRIHPSTDLAAASKGVDFALEAVSEVAEVKKRVFAQLDECCPDTVLASNTSGLDIFNFVEVKNPQKLLITHWFAPPHIIPLVEIASGPETADTTVDFAAALMERLGKKVIVMQKYIPSFIVNKIQGAIGMAIYELITGEYATPEEIDLAVKYSLGIRLPIVGVVQTLDFTGLDLIYDVVKAAGVSYPYLEEKVRMGHLGAKTARGIYDYGGRSEEEILRKRDERYLKLLDFLQEINAFEPV